MLTCGLHVYVQLNDVYAYVQLHVDVPLHVNMQHVDMQLYVNV